MRNAEHQCSSFIVPFITWINQAIAAKDLDKVTELYNDFAEAQAILFDYAYSWGKGKSPCNNTTFKNNKGDVMNKIGIAYVNMFEGNYFPWFWHYFRSKWKKKKVLQPKNKQKDY